jgi:predicted DNA binding CopG/RHH family protein
MKKINLDPVAFDDEERDLMEAFDKAFDDGSLVSHLTPERQAELQAAARATMNPPKKQISTRLAERDLVRLKAKALEQGMPYQSLLASIVHRYVEGVLVERER